MTRTEQAWFCAGVSVACAIISLLFVALAHGRSLSGVHRALLDLPVFHEDRAESLAAEKNAQLKAIADAVDRHGRTRTERAFVSAWGWHETRYSLRILDGQCKPVTECDYSRSTKTWLARGGWQVHKNALSNDEWERMHGLSNVDAQVAEATRRARGMLGVCGNAEGAFRAMTGRGCHAPLKDIGARIETFRRILRKVGG